jgi:hypothetical protein
MIPVFPLMIPGELPWSVAARWHVLNGGVDAAATMKALTGSDSCRRDGCWLPHSLMRMADSLDPQHPQADALVLLREHTIFPYCTYFLPRDLAKDVEGQVLVLDPGKIYNAYTSIGLSQHGPRVRADTALCPVCVAEDYAKGFTVWRREHQLPGIDICPHHLVPLQTACRPCDGAPGPKKSLLVTPNPVPCPHGESGRQNLVAPDAIDEIDRLLARSALWMLTHPDGFAGGHWHHVIRKVFTAAGLRRSGRVCFERVEAAMIERFGIVRMERAGLIGYHKGVRNNFGVRRALSRTDRVQHPLAYLMLSLLLRDSLEQLEADLAEAPIEDADPTLDLRWTPNWVGVLDRFREEGMTFAEMSRRLGIGLREVRYFHKRTRKQPADDGERRPDVEALVAEFAKLVPDRCIVNHQTGADVTRLDRALKDRPDARSIVTAALKAKSAATAAEYLVPLVAEADFLEGGLSDNRQPVGRGKAQRATGIPDAEMARIVLDKVRMIRLEDSRRHRLTLSMIRSIAGIPTRYRHRPAGTYPLTEAAIRSSVESREDHAKRMTVIAVRNAAREGRHIGYRSIWQTYQFPKNLRSVVMATAKEECARHDLVWELDENALS